MKITRKLSKPIDEDVDIFCNKCGLSCRSPMGEFYGLIEAEVVAGLESTHLKDGDVLKFSLCERCLADMFKVFIYSPFHGNYLEAETEQHAYSPEFNRAKYNKQGVLSLDDMTPEEIVTALDFEVPDYDDCFDDIQAGDNRSAEEIENLPPLTEEELAFKEEVRSYFQNKKFKKEDLN